MISTSRGRAWYTLTNELQTTKKCFFLFNTNIQILKGSSWATIYKYKKMYYRCTECKNNFPPLDWFIPSNNNAGIINRAQVFHAIFGQKLLSMVTDQDHLVGVFDQ